MIHAVFLLADPDPGAQLVAWDLCLERGWCGHSVEPRRHAYATSPMSRATNARRDRYNVSLLGYQARSRDGSSLHVSCRRRSIVQGSVCSTIMRNFVPGISETSREDPTGARAYSACRGSI